MIDLYATVISAASKIDAIYHILRGWPVAYRVRFMTPVNFRSSPRDHLLVTGCEFSPEAGEQVMDEGEIERLVVARAWLREREGEK